MNYRDLLVDYKKNCTYAYHVRFSDDIQFSVSNLCPQDTTCFSPAYTYLSLVECAVGDVALVIGNNKYDPNFVTLVKVISVTPFEKALQDARVADPYSGYIVARIDTALAEPMLAQYNLLSR